jgi:hypothetical protein
MVVESEGWAGVSEHRVRDTQPVARAPDLPCHAMASPFPTATSTVAHECAAGFTHQG